MSLPECEHMIRALNDRKDELLNQSLLVEYKLLKEFLTQLKRIKDDELIRLKRETSVIQDDLNLVESLVENVQQMKIEVADPDDPEGKIVGFQLEFVSISQVINHMTCYNLSALIGLNYSIQTGEQIL